jgi:hypothetical protein
MLKPHLACLQDLAGSCFLGGKVADEFHEVLLGNLGNPQAPLLPLAVSCYASWKLETIRPPVYLLHSVATFLG